MQVLKHTEISVIFSCILLVSCQVDFKIQGATSGKLYLQCFPGASDTVVVQLLETYPLGAVTDRHEQAFIHDAEIVLSVNGNDKVALFAANDTGMVPEGCWYIPGQPFSSGDKLRFVVSSADGRQIAAESIVPDNFPEYDFSFSDGGLSLSFADPEKVDDYYGIIVELRAVAIEDTTKVIHSFCVWNEDMLDCLGVPFSNSWTFGDVAFQVRMWRDDSCQDKDGSIRMSWHDSVFPGLLGTYNWTSSHRLHLYKFSEEFYRYAVAYNNVMDNHFAKFGIAPASFAFSNVSGGLGIVAACSHTTSDWIPDDFFSDQK